MGKDPLPIVRLPQRLRCDARLTILRFFWPGSAERAQKIVERIAALDDDGVSSLLASTLSEFRPTHPDLDEVLNWHWREVMERIGAGPEADDERRLLIGAYFTMEYAYESAALFNPSMVPARDQTGVEAGSIRFLMSLRAVGEGHLSSIVFRTGTIGRNIEIKLDPVASDVRRANPVTNRKHDRRLFRQKLIEMGAFRPSVDGVLAKLHDEFTTQELAQAIRQTPLASEAPTGTEKLADSLMWLARSSYQIRFGSSAGLTGLVVFPTSDVESHGIEDMRLVRFVDDDGSVRYYGTYTAYDGRRILPQLMESSEPGIAEVHVLNGRYVQNKGMALFPRKIDGSYAMIGRVDGENLYLLRSDNVRFWNEAVRIREPRHGWEFVQIGNCGSPIETDAGWILLTHGVGPMRRYCIGAVLLDLHDPARIIGALTEPLLAPQPDERAGYVPNVVYSCGGMLHAGSLVIPYGIGDVATGFAVVPLDALLDRLKA